MMKQLVLAGGCFWCTEAVFERIKGVEKVVPGFTGGKIKNPAYREVRTGRTGHAEAVKIYYDSEKVTLKTLLEVFFATHDPTTLNKQGNDKGTQYRSGVFYESEEQKIEIEEFVLMLKDNKIFDAAIVTEITKFAVFYDAEANHHSYYSNNKDQPYCEVIISPKLDKIKKLYAKKLK